MYGGEYTDLDKLKAKQEKNEIKYPLSRVNDIVPIEDLIEGEEERVEFNKDRTEWAIQVLKTLGFPKGILGTIVIRGYDDYSELTIYIE